MIGSASILMAVGLALVLVFRPTDRRILHAFFVNLASVPILVSAALVFEKISAASQIRYDEFLYQLDRYFGSPAYPLGIFLAGHHWALRAVVFDYRLFVDAAEVCIVITFLKSGVREGYRAFGSVLTAAVFLTLFYKLLPASGPAFAFKGFPFIRPAFHSPHKILLSSPPNCFPSGHLTMALLCLFLLRAWPILRAIAILHVALTIAATLGLGEHYVIDLIASVPYVSVVLLVWGWSRSSSPAELVPSAPLHARERTGQFPAQ